MLQACQILQQYRADLILLTLITAVGCLEGFKVEGSAESVGRHTTASVVQSIFLVIVFDALFAMFFMELKV